MLINVTSWDHETAACEDGFDQALVHDLCVAIQNSIKNYYEKLENLFSFEVKKFLEHLSKKVGKLCIMK